MELLTSLSVNGPWTQVAEAYLIDKDCFCGRCPLGQTYPHPPPSGIFDCNCCRRLFRWVSSLEETQSSHDPVSRPKHYNSHPSGVECIQITEHMNFCRGNAIKYLWRAGEKGSELEDLKKAKWYIEREIARIEKLSVDKMS